LAAVFQLFDGTLAQAGPNVLGVWETAPAPPEGAVSFAAPGEAAPEVDVPVWSVNLTGDLRQAATDLEESLARVDVSRDALATARTRLDSLVAHTQSTSEVSFAVASAQPDLPAAEQELLKQLAAIKGEDAEVSFGLFGLPSRGDLEAAGDQFKSVMARIAQSLLYYALVETRVEGQLLGRTAIGWSADAKTLWPIVARPELFELHRRSLKLAVESRNSLLRMFMLTAQAAVKLSALLATPGAQLLALPTAWKFINQVLAEIGQYRELQHQN
jgi:hypothetical protein